ncbi:MAG: cell division protein ZapE [Pseudomonadota bacterium]
MSERTPQTTPLQAYRAMIAAGEIDQDPAQALAMEKLQLLSNRLASYTPPAKTDWFSFFTRKRGAVPKGLYMFGGVGRGKTMLMDIFFQNVAFPSKRRVHFHAFMADVHARISVTRKATPGDPLPKVAEALAREAALLCFDEFHVTDIADAMILARLFDGLFEREVVMVATSNVAPTNLYRNGLNRGLFEPFIALLEDAVEVLYLDVNKDYRQDKLAGSPLYFSPADDVARAALREAWTRLTGTDHGTPEKLTVKGRNLPVPEAAGGAAWFQYGDLFEAPLGANDYLAIAARYHTVFVEGVPQLGRHKRNEARRLVTFVDALYDAHTRLLVSADVEPDAIYPSGDDAFLFERTASRLTEMRSEDYAMRLPSI